MILVDDRESSAKYARLLPDPTIVVRLEYGDVAFMGHGPNGNVSVGIEIKTLGDLIGSIQSGRLFGHQVPGMCQDYDIKYLLLEGVWRRGSNGQLETRGIGGRWFPWNFSRGWTAAGLWGALTSLENCGFSLRYPRSMSDTAHTIEDLYGWWDRPWSAHKSHIQLNNVMAHKLASFQPEAASLLVNFAAQLPGVGPTKAREVEAVFGSVPGMIEASVKEWMRVPGIGKTLATMAYEALHGKE